MLNSMFTFCPVVEIFGRDAHALFLYFSIIQQPIDLGLN